MGQDKQSAGPLDPTISVVLPTRNGRRHIDQSIRSIVAQSFADWELIIVDDASTDDSVEKISAWAERDKRIRVVSFTENVRLPAALNAGFREAKGSLWTWTSDDNWYHPTAFAKMLQVLREKPDVSVVYSDVYWVDAGGDVSVRNIVGPAEALQFGNCIGSCFLYRPAVHAHVGGFDEDKFLAEDYDFWLRASNQFKFEFIPDRLYFYRTTGGLSKRETEIRVITEKALFEWLSGKNWLDDKRRVRAFMKIARSAFDRGDTAAGRRYLRGALAAGGPQVCLRLRSRLVDAMLGARLGSFVRRTLMYRQELPGKPSGTQL